jgi:hypothetical protein
MPTICYIPKAFHPGNLAIIHKAQEIIEIYKNQGFTLTLRQLYYQFVARDILPNNMRSYKRLGIIINDARLAGVIDWDAITDRTRELRGRTHWNTPGQIVQAAAKQYHLDRWKGQECRPEVWIEKDALLGPFEGVCSSLDVDYFSCRGYTSQSEMWGAGQRMLNRYNTTNQKTIILHFGDHDPSGMDMSRDIFSRLLMFTNGEKTDPDEDLTENDVLEIKRVALNMNQVRQYKPPPNPAKITDSRTPGYIAQFGKKSWELDALEPKTLAELVQEEVTKLIDDNSLWNAQAKREEQGKKKILNAGKKLK